MSLQADMDALAVKDFYTDKYKDDPKALAVISNFRADAAMMLAHRESNRHYR